jgi:hypothetical protein
MLIISYTNEMVAASNIEAISKALITEAVSLALDSALFSSNAGAGATPPGILYGTTPIVPVAGGGLNAMTGDIKNLMNALVTAGAGAAPVIVTNPTQATTLKLMAGPKFDMPVLQSSSVAAGTLVMIEPSSFVSAFGAAPDFEVSPHAMVTFDSAPADFPAGSVKSTFSIDSVSLRMTLKASWGMRAPHLAVVTGATW